MKIFDSDSGWATKVNFVDEHNVLLGYDMSSQCCENADWFVADRPTLALSGDKPKDLSGWVFDPSYRKDVSEIFEDGSSWNSLDAGGMVIFRIVNGEAEKFIHLFNSHNGYYSHGFEFSANGQSIHEGSL